MINRHLRSVPGALMAGAIVAIASANGGCSAASTATNALNNAEQATSSCDEFTSGGDAVGMLSIDGDTKAFVTASASLDAIAKYAETDGYGACKHVCGGLKTADASTGKENGADGDAAVPEACHQASVKISGPLTADAGC